MEGNVGGRGWAGWSGVKGGKWDNCNSIINKYILKKEKKQTDFNTKTRRLSSIKAVSSLTQK